MRKDWGGLSQESTPYHSGLCDPGPYFMWQGQVDCKELKPEEFGNNCTHIPSLSFQKVSECRSQVQPQKSLCPPATASLCQGDSRVCSVAPDKGLPKFPKKGRGSETLFSALSYSLTFHRGTVEVTLVWGPDLVLTPCFTT